MNNEDGFRVQTYLFVRSSALQHALVVKYRDEPAPAPCDIATFPIIQRIGDVGKEATRYLRGLLHLNTSYDGIIADSVRTEPGRHGSTIRTWDLWISLTADTVPNSYSLPQLVILGHNMFSWANWVELDECPVLLPPWLINRMPAPVYNLLTDDMEDQITSWPSFLLRLTANS